MGTEQKKNKQKKCNKTKKPAMIGHIDIHNSLVTKWHLAIECLVTSTATVCAPWRPVIIDGHVPV